MLILRGMSNVSRVDRRTIVKTSKAKAIEAMQGQKDKSSKYNIFYLCAPHLTKIVSLDLLLHGL